jgi:hypothetical protein
MAHELQKLTERVRKLREEIRAGAIPAGGSDRDPIFPTEPERRLRSMKGDREKG